MQLDPSPAISLAELAASPQRGEAWAGWLCIVPGQTRRRPPLPMGWDSLPQSCRQHTTPSSSARGTTASSPPHISPRPASRCWCSNAATSSAVAASPRNRGPASRSPRPRTSTACSGPEIIRDLELKKYGFEMLPRARRRSRRIPDGRYLMMGPDKAMTLREIAKFVDEGCRGLPEVRGDAHARRGLPRTDARADAARSVLQSPRRPVEARQDRLEFPRPRPQHVATEAIEILTGAARPILDRWFESEQLKATIATDAVIGAFAPPSHPGTAYVLFHHVMGECNGVRGVWGYVRGGMGTISNSIAAAARAARRRDSHRVRGRPILVKDGRADGRRLQDGTEFHARRVVSGADANVTFLKLMDAEDLPAEFLAQVKRIDYSSATVKINVALIEPPQFKACPVRASARSITAPCTSARTWTTSSGLTTTPSTASRSAQPDARMHDGHGPGQHARPARPAHPQHVRAVRPVRTERHDAGTWSSDQLRRPLLRRAERVRSELQGVGAAPAGDCAAGHGAVCGASPAATSCRGR